MAKTNARIIPYQGKLPDIHPSVFLADGVVIVGDVTLAEDVNVWCNAVIRGDVNTIRIGARTNVQDNSTLHVTWNQYSLNIGADVTIGHGVTLHGCTIHDRVLIGMGAVVLDGAEVFPESLIAAGTLVRQHFEVPEGSLVAGVPGKIARRLNDEERRGIAESAQHYMHYVNEYRAHDDLGQAMDFDTYLRLRHG